MSRCWFMRISHFLVEISKHTDTHSHITCITRQHTENHFFFWIECSFVQCVNQPTPNYAKLYYIQQLAWRYFGFAIEQKSQIKSNFGRATKNTIFTKPRSAQTHTRGFFACFALSSFTFPAIGRIDPKGISIYFFIFRGTALTVTNARTQDASIWKFLAAANTNDSYECHRIISGNCSPVRSIYSTVDCD